MYTCKQCNSYGNKAHVKGRSAHSCTEQHTPQEKSFIHTGFAVLPRRSRCLGTFTADTYLGDIPGCLKTVFWDSSP